MAGPTDVRLGTNPGWVLRFFEDVTGPLPAKPFLEITADDYACDIDASLAAELDGGRYTFAVEGMTDAHHLAIAKPKGGAAVAARLHLYWRDATWSGWAASYFGGAIGIDQWVGGLSEAELTQTLVAELSITSVARRLGTRRYETVIQARERAFDLLNRFSIDGTKPPASILEGLHSIFDASGLSRTVAYGFDEGTGAPKGKLSGAPEEVPWHAGASGARALRDLGEAVEACTGKYGRGMALIRDGAVHFGVRPIPLTETSRDGAPPEPPKPLTIHSGLLQAVPERATSSDPFWSFHHPDLDNTEPTGRPQWTVSLRGRADLKPGDVIAFERPPETDATTPTIGAAFAGPFGGALLPSMTDAVDPSKAATVYVTSVRHQLGRAVPFLTTVTGVELVLPDDPWDPAPLGSKPLVADPAAQAAGAIQQKAEGARRAAGAAIDIAEVKSANVKSQSSPVVAAQTVTATRGLVDAKGAGSANASRALAVDRKQGTELRGAAYATPFAFGTCGLVLPQYPGTRLVLVHRQGEPADPVAVGSTWGPDARPEAAAAGDWWLSLPAEVAANERASLPAGKEPQPYKGKASHDLIDGDGGRIIQVGALTIRIGKDALVDTSTRPALDAATVVIEHVDKKARIEIAQDGSITIETPENLTLKAKKEIRMEAADVKVKVTNKMDVS